MDCKPKFGEITVGSKSEFDLVITTGGRPFDFSPYSGGNLVFLNNLGVRTVIALPIPGATPQSGILAVSISAVEAADADQAWVNADLELTHPTPANSKVVPIYDKFKIIKRNAPPSV